MSGITCQVMGGDALRFSTMADTRRELAERLRFLDASLWLGRPEGFPLAEELSANHLEEVLKSRFITGGLVSHWRGKTVSAQEGNVAVLQALRECSCPAPQSAIRNPQSLFAVWTGLPLFPTEEGPLPGKESVPEAVKAVRLFPRSHNFPLADWCVGSLCKWLASRNMPLFLWHTELDWPSLHRLAQAFPVLPIVVETQTQKILYHTRPLFALMRDCPNVHVELSNFAGQGFVEYAVREFGAERLVFGSFLPASDPFVPMGMVLDAEISEDAKVLIAGENLRRLTSQVQP